MSNHAIVDYNQRDDMNTVECFAARWTSTRGKQAGSGWFTSRDAAARIADEMAGKGREGVHLQRAFFGGFV